MSRCSRITEDELSGIIHHLKSLKVADKAKRLGAQAVAIGVYAFVMENVNTGLSTDQNVPDTAADITGEDDLGEGEDLDELRTTTASSGGYADPSIAPFPNPNHIPSNIATQARLDSLTGVEEYQGNPHPILRRLHSWARPIRLSE